MQDWIASWFDASSRTLVLWCAGAALILLFWLISRIYAKVLHPALVRFYQRRGRSLLEVLSHNYGRPLAWFCALLGWELAAYTAPLPAGAAHALHVLFRLASIVLVGWGLAGSSELVAYLLRNACRRLDVQTGKSVVSFLASLFKIVVWAFVAVILLSELGYDVNGLVAGLGLGGLTVALAAKESASNFFSGLVLIFEKPFIVGEFITCGELSGTAEKVTFRATQLRTMDDSVVIVPNSTLCSAPITNWSRMRRRLVRFSIGLRYDTAPETLTRLISEITAMLKATPDLQPDTVAVSLEKFSASSLDVMIRYYISLPEYDRQFGINQAINLEILRIVHECGADFAFPSQSLYFEGGKAAR